MNSLSEGALSVLERVYSNETGLFPFTNRLVGTGYRSVFDHPQTMLSTVNCLLGLQEAARHAPDHPFLERVGEMTRAFLGRHEDAVTDPGVLGLSAVLLAESEERPEALGRVLARVRAIAGDESQVAGLTVQQVSWLLWGAVATARSGMTQAEPVAHSLFRTMADRFLTPGDALPRHAAGGLRGGLVSFGASVYYLRSAHEYGRQYQSAEALGLFDEGVSALLSAQGPQGEWPWLVSCKDGRPLDYYPVFSVHQHSMSMLFLFPGRPRGGAEIATAIDRSISWITGANQLGEPLVRRDPFFIYRSHERKALLPRGERFLRARWMLLSGRRANVVPNGRLRVNTESRSYELGWILYVLSASGDLAGID